MFHFVFRAPPSAKCKRGDINVTDHNFEDLYMYKSMYVCTDIICVYSSCLSFGRLGGSVPNQESFILNKGILHFAASAPPAAKCKK